MIIKIEMSSKNAIEKMLEPDLEGGKILKQRETFWYGGGEICFRRGDEKDLTPF